MPDQLFGSTGKRLYLVHEERLAFMKAADALPREQRTFCYVLCLAGPRISEALAMDSGSIDVAAGALVFKTLKKRRDNVFRAVPAPPTLMDMLQLAHDLKRSRPRKPQPLWPFGRTRAWQIVKATMKAAGVKGSHATPKGLRHGFGVRAVQTGVPLNLLQRWLGHANISTTAIYANAIGAEERGIAARMWD